MKMRLINAAKMSSMKRGEVRHGSTAICQSQDHSEEPAPETLPDSGREELDIHAVAQIVEHNGVGKLWSCCPLDAQGLPSRDRVEDTSHNAYTDPSPADILPGPVPPRLLG